MARMFPLMASTTPKGTFTWQVGQDPIQVGQEQRRQFLEGGEPLPPERQAPRGQEAAAFASYLYVQSCVS